MARFAQSLAPLFPVVGASFGTPVFFDFDGGGNMSMWKGDPSDDYPRCVFRECDVDSDIFAEMMEACVSSLIE